MPIGGHSFPSSTFQLQIKVTKSVILKFEYFLLLSRQPYRVADNKRESPHAGIGQSRVEAVAAQVLTKDCLHVDWQLGE